MQTKICKTCKKELVLESFYLHKGMADGHLNICKPCTKIRVAARAEVKREEIRKYDRLRGRTEKRKAKSRLWQKQNKEKCNERARSYYRKNSVKRRARSVMSWALVCGKIAKSIHCSDCNVSGVRLEAHHEDYLAPLSVIWLCVDCHHKRHRKYKD